MDEGLVVRKRREHLVHKQAFEEWFKQDRHFRKTAEALGSVTEKSLFAWAKEFGWRARADERDLEVERAAMRDAVNRQRKLLEKQRGAGEMLRLRGIEHLSKTPIARAADAIKAVRVGIELERQAEGLPTWILELQNLTDDELLNEKQRLLRLALLEAEGSRDGVVGAEVEAEEEAADTD